MSSSAPLVAEGSRPRILVVEDEALIALDLERRLQRAGYAVVGVTDNRDETLALVQQHTPDLVLMDVCIQPPVDGIETAVAVSAISDVPVIFLTAYADDETVRRATAASPYGYLLKPFDERTLLATVRVVIERHAADTRQRLLGAAAADSSVAITLADVRGERRQVTYANDAWLQWAGVPRDQVEGHPPQLLTDAPEDPEAQELARALEERRPGAGVIRMQREGRTRWLSVTVSPSRSRAGDVTHLLVLHTDITRLRATEEALADRERTLREREALETQLRRRTEELSASLQQLRSAQHELVQREKLASLGELVAGLAHEVNAPLGVAITAASLAREALEGIDQAVQRNDLKRSVLLSSLDTAIQSLQALEANLHRGTELVRHFKTVAVDRSGSLSRRFELGAYAREVIGSLGPMLRHSRVRVRVEQTAVVELFSRPGDIAQILTNFVTNALMHAFSPESDGEVVVTVGRSGDEATIEVRDNGVGMPPEVAPHAFDPFFTTRRGNGGSGLGLFIVHNLVTEGLSGSVRLETTPGRGSSFHIRFPIATDGPTTAGV